MERFVCLDVEMPNGDANRISAIGVVAFVGGEVTRRCYSLLNPETWFQPYVVKLTGITPEMVQNAPTFRDYWPTIEPLLTGSVIVAHGAGNDLKALAACLRHYKIDWQPAVPYLCTVEACTAVYPDRGAYALGLLCADFDIPLEHHNALSDAEGCGRLLLRCLQDGLDPAPFVKSFDLLRTPDEKRRQKRPPRKKGAALQAQATVRDWLEPLCDETVRAETAARLSLPPERVLGVPLQSLVALERAHHASDTLVSFLRAVPHDYHEENLLHAIILSNRNRFAVTLKGVEAFLPFVDNAEVCAALRPKLFKKKQPELGRLLRRCLTGDEKYPTLFALQTLERTYIKTPMLPTFLEIVGSLSPDDPDLAAARDAFFQKALALAPQKTRAYLDAHGVRLEQP